MKSSLIPVALAVLFCASGTAQAQTPEVCTEVYQPVCGTDENGTRRTYSNACYARRAKAKDVTPGECPK
jgi:Kazal-type serine protease inhibitor domain